MTLQTSEPLAASRFESYPREAFAFLDEIERGGVVLDPPYQRGSVWTRDQQRNLIRSFLLGLPIPALIMNDRGTHTWAEGERQPVYVVVDGKQRIEAAVAWFRNELDVPASWFPGEWVERSHVSDDGPYVFQSDLSDVGARFVRRQGKFPCAVATVTTVAAEAQIFSLVNGTGTAQDPATLAEAARIGQGLPAL